MTRFHMIVATIALVSFITTGALLMIPDDAIDAQDAATQVPDIATKVVDAPSPATVKEGKTATVVAEVAPSNVDPVNLDPEEILVGENPDYPTLDMRLTEMEARRDGEKFQATQVLAAMKQPSAWVADDSVADELKLSSEDRYDGRTFVRFNPLKVETLMPGDTMDIPIEQINANYQMLVARVEAHGDGSVTWHGNLKDFESENQISITQSKGMTYIGISTPDVPYTVQVHGNAGFVVSSGTLFKGKDEHLEMPEGAETTPGSSSDFSNGEGT